MRPGPSIALTCVLATALVACGEDPSRGPGSATATTAAPVAASTSVARYRAAADRVCVRFAQDVQRISRELGTPRRFAQQGPYERATADALAEQTGRLRAVVPPETLRERHRVFARAAADYGAAYERTAQRATAGDEPGWTAAVRAHQRVGTGLIEAAQALGLQACARRPSLREARAVRAVVRRVLLGGDPARSCAQDVTPGFLRSNLSGTPARCRDVLAGLARDGATLRFTDRGVEGITGVDGVLASANVLFATTRGGAPLRLVYDLVHEDGAWKLDSAFAPPSASGEAPRDDA